MMSVIMIVMAIVAALAFFVAQRAQRLRHPLVMKPSKPFRFVPPTFITHMPDLIGQEHRVIALIGVTGAGKSVLARHLLDQFLQANPARRVFLVDKYPPDPLVLTAWAARRGWSWKKRLPTDTTPLTERLTLLTYQEQGAHHDQDEFSFNIPDELTDNDCIVLDHYFLNDRMMEALALTPAHILVTAQGSRDIAAFRRQQEVLIGWLHGREPEQESIQYQRDVCAEVIFAGARYCYAIAPADMWWYRHTITGPIHTSWEELLLAGIAAVTHDQQEMIPIIQRIMGTTSHTAVQAACFSALARLSMPVACVEAAQGVGLLSFFVSEI